MKLYRRKLSNVTRSYFDPCHETSRKELVQQDDIILIVKHVSSFRSLVLSRYGFRILFTPSKESWACREKAWEHEWEKVL